MKRLGLVGLLFGVALACSQPPRASTTAPVAAKPGEITAFVDVSVVPMDREVIHAGQTVLVRGDRIVEIGPSARLTPPKGARVIAGKGKFLLPGLSDMHSHLRHEEDLMLYVARGVTTVRNMWGTPMHLEWRERVVRGDLMGPRIYTTGPILDGDTPDHDGSAIVSTPEAADQAVAVGREAGYDFVKVYSFLPAPAYQRIITAARLAGLPVVGHVPRDVGLAGVIAAGQSSVEHLAGFIDGIQRDDSPAKGKFDWPSRAKKLDLVDESKIATVVRQMKQHRVWSCPTRVVMDQRGSLAATKLRMTRPDMIYVSEDDRAVWEPAERSAEKQLTLDRELALSDRLIRALADGGAGLVLGTDAGNPLVIPGFSVHDELRHFVRVGLSPYRALRTATADAAEMLGATSDLGTVAVGRRADLLLLEGNPLSDITQTSRIAGVMQAGHWYGKSELGRVLAKVAEAYRGWHDPFAGKPPLGPDSARDFAATFRVTWKGALFGAERIWVGRAPDGELVVRSETYDPHEAQHLSVETWPGPAGVGRRMRSVSDGASGRGRAELDRQQGTAKLTGRLLPGFAFERSEALAEGAVIAMEKSLTSTVLLLPSLRNLAIGGAFAAQSAELALGSAAKLQVANLQVVRVDASHFEIRRDKAPMAALTVDAEGWPARVVTELYGARLQHERIP